MVLPCNVVKKVREGFLENSMKSEEPHKRQSGGEEKEAHSGRGNHRYGYGSKQSNIKGIKLSIKIIECVQPERISPEEILGLLTGR